MIKLGDHKQNMEKQGVDQMKELLDDWLLFSEHRIDEIGSVARNDILHSLQKRTRAMLGVDHDCA